MDRSSNGTGETGNRSSAAGIGHSWLKYLLTLVLCAVAMQITMVLPGAKSNPIFLFLMVAVAISAWYGGWHCAILATFLSLLGEFYLIYPSLRANFVSPVLITRLTAMVVLLVATCIAFSLLRAAGSRNREMLAREKLARAEVEAAMAHQKQSQELLERDDGRILEANHAAVLAYGYTREELLALTIHDLRAPETRALTPTQMQEAGNSGILFETVHVRKNGSRFPVEVSSRGAEVGGVRTLISIVRDITARRGVEESR